MNTTASKNGRPKTKGSLRNFKFREDIDRFLAEESQRTGRDMTFILESLLLKAKAMKPAARDAEFIKALEAA